MQTFYRYAIPALWLAWLLCWGAAAMGTKPTQRRESFASQLSHVVPLAMGVALLATLRVPFAWLSAPVLPAGAVGFWAGLALVVAGLGLSIAGRAWLGGNWSGTVTVKLDHELIRSGPYRSVRHPIYTGLLLMALGTAMLEAHTAAFGLWAFIGLVLWIKLQAEERLLTRHFPEAYPLYRRRVRALIPFLL
jgi:protein-S-isoprenylcysteine O-methyltransferase Ste14